MKIKIDYNGSYPNLCSGILKVTFKDLIIKDSDKSWTFTKYCMSSGGGTHRDDDGDYSTTHGEWGVDEWPDDFPDELKDMTLEAVNDQIDWGCCGGCI